MACTFRPETKYFRISCNRPSRYRVSTSNRFDLLKKKARFRSGGFPVHFILVHKVFAETIKHNYYLLACCTFVIDLCCCGNVRGASFLIGFRVCRFACNRVCRNRTQFGAPYGLCFWLVLVMYLCSYTFFSNQGNLQHLSRLEGLFRQDALDVRTILRCAT